MSNIHALAESLGLNVRQLAITVHAAATDAQMDTSEEDSAETCFAWFMTLPIEAQRLWASRAPKVTT